MTATTTWQPVPGPRSPDDLPPALRDPVADQRLRRDGFVTFPVIDGARADRLHAAYGDLHGWEGGGFEPDLVNPDVAYRRAVDRLLAAELDDAVVGHFVDHRPFLRNFLCKWPGSDSGLYLHQDWSYVDERRGASTYVVWVALSDVVGHEGQLRVLRGSHLLQHRIRGTDLTPRWWDAREVVEPRLQDVPVPRGWCVVMDNGLLHGSHPNHTDAPRLVAAVGVRPASSPLAYFRADGPGRAARWDVDEAFFTHITPQDLHAAAPDEHPAERIDLAEEDLDEIELAERLDRLTSRSLLRRAADRLSTGRRRRP